MFSVVAVQGLEDKEQCVIHGSHILYAIPCVYDCMRGLVYTLLKTSEAPWSEFRLTSCRGESAAISALDGSLYISCTNLPSTQ